MSPAAITLIFLTFAILLFVTEKIPLGLTSMVVCIGLVVTGVLSVGDAFSGFINSNVILFVAMFIVGGALTSDEAVRAAMAEFSEAGCDELILFPCSPVPDQLHQLAAVGLG